MSYLSHDSFLEPNRGPWIDSDMHHYGKDPSRRQIAQRCAVIRRHAPRRPVGPSCRWSAPVVNESDLAPLDVDAGDLMERTA